MAIPNQLAEFHLTFFSYIIVIQTSSGASLLFFFLRLSYVSISY